VPRILDGTLDRLLRDLPAVAIVGPKAVGKTATAIRRARTVVDLGDASELALVGSDPTRIARLERPLLVDEWQVHPPVWDQVRRAVDAGAPPGSFLLTGSTAPVTRPMHSGAGRIVRARMRPLALAERGLVEHTVSLQNLLTGSRPRIEGDSLVTLADYAHEIVASGFPGLRGVATRSLADALDEYLGLVVERDFAEVGHIVRRPNTLRRWLRAYAAATATTASYNVILDAATPGEPDKPAKSTAIAYRETLERMWLIEEVPAWLGDGNRLSSLGRTPKHHLADPALAARLLGVGAGALLDRPNPSGIPVLRDGPLIGSLFESLVTMSVLTYADAAGARVSHLRTHRGDHEVDLIIERADGRVVAVEVKLAPVADAASVKHLRWLRQRIGDDLLDAVVITTGPGAYRREDGIAVVPAALLGP
jgi:predicted AAA+ superfamily ATPase